jgi:type I site-specific restriction-modification system R (restriction) subunit
MRKYYNKKYLEGGKINKPKLTLGKVSDTRLNKYYQNLKIRPVSNLKQAIKLNGYYGYSKFRKNDLILSMLHTFTNDQLENLPIYIKLERSKRIKKGLGEIIKLQDKERKDEESETMCIKASNPKLKVRQKRVINNFISSGVNGYLISHGTGCGKTLTAVAYSQCYLQKNPNNKIIVITPASLQNNFRDGMEFYGIDWRDPRYEIYSYNKFIRFMTRVGKVYCNNALLIVDEVQNLKNTYRFRML